MYLNLCLNAWMCTMFMSAEVRTVPQILGNVSHKRVMNHFVGT